MDLAIDTAKEDREALRWILNYHELRKAYIALTTEFNEIAATAYTGMPHGSDVGKPTENKTVTLMELERQKTWLITIECLEKTMSEKARAFLEFRRRAECVECNNVGRPGWVDYVQVRYGEWHERRYGRAFVPSRRVMYNWMDKMVDVTVRIAIRKGCL